MTTGSRGLFASFFLGGFECSTHRRPDRRRLDLIAGTGHDRLAAADYRQLAAHGIRAARDGVRWHLVETVPGRYDWASFLPMLRAARDAGVQVVWDLCHYGYPDDLDPWEPAFVDRFARFAAAAARVVREETDAVPFYCPVNEISFWAWCGGDTGNINPWARGRGPELKVQLARANLAAIEAVRGVDRRARFVQAEPVINILPRRPEDRAVVEAYTLSQFESWDMICGRLRPDLGGRPEHLDIVGLNYYWNNQWVDAGEPIDVGHPLYKPFRSFLADTHERYGRPVLVAETGVEGERRPAWLRYIGAEVRAAIAAGVPVEGICLYPITEYAGWDDDRRCETGLLGRPLEAGEGRPVYAPLAAELRRQQRLFAPAARRGRRDDALATTVHARRPRPAGHPGNLAAASPAA